MLGIILVLISALCLAIQNVALKVIVSPQIILGQFSTGGWVSPTPEHSLLLLNLRIFLMLILVLALSPKLYPKAALELRQTFNLQNIFSRSKRSRYVLQTCWSGCCLFVAQTLLYVAISYLPTGIAVTIFFVHPALTVLLAWGIWKEQPKPVQLGVMVIVFVGVYLTSPLTGTLNNHQGLTGVAAALIAGICFAGYSLTTQQCLQGNSLPNNTTHQPLLHPISFSIAVFTIVLILTSLVLLFIPIQIDPYQWQVIWIMSGFSAIAAMIAYVLNNFGIRLIGASKASLISAMTPILTTLLALLLLQESLIASQGIGILLVTGGIALLSFSEAQ
ncbi:MAG: hypothetical protein Kow00121_51640 [Elainellaceae cyanobacterium]